MTGDQEKRLDAASLRDALGETSRRALREVARTTGITYEQSWSGVDLVIAARYLASQDQRRHVVDDIDRCMGELWQCIAAEINAGDLSAIDATASRALAVLTVRFPSSAVHEGFVKAFRMVSRGHVPAVQPAASLLTPVWHKTIDRADSDTLETVFAACHDMFLPGDYFVGYSYAWRFGPEVAKRYVRALMRAFGTSTTMLPLGSDSDLDSLERMIRQTLSEATPGHTDSALLMGLHGPLAAWSTWLAEILWTVPQFELAYAGELDSPTEAAVADDVAELGFVDDPDEPELTAKA